MTGTEIVVVELGELEFSAASERGARIRPSATALSEEADKSLEAMLESTFAANLIDGKGPSGGDHDRGGRLLLSSPQAAPSAARAPLSPHQDGGVRLHVYRWILWMQAHPRSPCYWDSRPETLPPEITVFHTGLLYSAVQQAGLPSSVFAYRGALVFMPLILLSVALNTLASSSSSSSASENARHIFLLLLVFAAYVLGHAVSGCVFWRGLRRIEDQMEAVARRLDPAFRAAGHRLEYRSSPRSWYSPSYESYFCIAPCSGATAMTAEEREQAAALMKPFAAAVPAAAAGRSARAFRVAVYGPKAWGGSLYSGSEVDFVSIQSFYDVKNRIDMATWGAVATEMRPLTDKYRAARTWASGVVLIPGCFYLYLPVEWTEQTWSISLLFALLLVMVVQLCCPAPVETWWFDYVLRRSVLDQMRDKVARLSALVEERSGYVLRFDTERHGCFGDISGFVCFDLLHDSSAATDYQTNEMVPSQQTETEFALATLV